MDYRVLFKQTLTVLTHKPNRNCSTHKHKRRLPGIVQSSDESFTIISIKREKNLLRTYMNQQTKHKCRLPGIVQASFESSHIQTKNKL